MDVKDRDHERCSQLLLNWPTALLVPAPVVIELDWLAASRLGPHPFGEFLTNALQGSVTVVELTRADYQRALALYAQYQDLPLGFVDASVVAVAERLRATDIATLDHGHLHVVRPRHVGAFNLLPA